MAEAASGHLGAYAVEDDAVELTWSSMPAREVTVGVGPVSVQVDCGPPAWRFSTVAGARPLAAAPGGPGAAVLTGLEPATTYPVWWRARGRAPRTVGRVTTLAPPPGALLHRFATVSDLHIGERRFGTLQTIADVHPRSGGLEPYPVRALQAALAEAVAWGASTLVVKGDLTDRSRLPEFRAVAEAVRHSGLDTLVQLGNHDRRRPVDLSAALPGLPVSAGGHPLVADLPGVRLVLADTPSPEDRRGHLDERQIEDLAAAVAGGGRPSVLTLHHPPERWPVPTHYPPGLVRADTRRLLGALSATGPCLLLAGHSHRNRTYRLGGRLVAEVGSTKDHPGGWAGYAVHEGGIRQVVRRTGRADVLRWTEATAAALGGLWGRWSPGRLTDRCWSRTWQDLA